MEKKLSEMLERKDLKDLKQIFLTHKVFSVDAVKMITDAQFDLMGVPVGQVVTSRAAIKSKDDLSGEEKKDRIAAIMKQIRGKEKDSQKEQEKSSKISKNSKPSRNKTGKTRNINYGWLHRTSKNNVYKQVKKKKRQSLL